MKKIFCIMLMLVLVIGIFSLVGCSSDDDATASTSAETTEPTTEQVTPKSAFEKAGFEHILTTKAENNEYVSIDGSLSYYRELGTDVMYIFYTGYKRAGLTVMMDPETNGPMLYTNWLKYQNEKALEITE